MPESEGNPLRPRLERSEVLIGGWCTLPTPCAPCSMPACCMVIASR